MSHTFVGKMLLVSIVIVMASMALLVGQRISQADRYAYEVSVTETGYQYAIKDRGETAYSYSIVAAKDGWDIAVKSN